MTRRDWSPKVNAGLQLVFIGALCLLGAVFFPPLLAMCAGFTLIGVTLTVLGVAETPKSTTIVGGQR